MVVLEQRVKKINIFKERFVNGIKIELIYSKDKEAAK